MRINEIICVKVPKESTHQRMVLFPFFRFHRKSGLLSFCLFYSSLIANKALVLKKNFKIRLFSVCWHYECAAICLAPLSSILCLTFPRRLKYIYLLLKSLCAITVRVMIEIIIKILPIYHYDGSAHFPAAYFLLSILSKEILYGFFTIEKVVKN